MLNGDGHVRFIYYSQEKAVIDIYDFSMHHIIMLEEDININDEHVLIWDGKDNNGNKVVNGTYFCKLSSNNNTYWTKLIIIN